MSRKEQAQDIRRAVYRLAKDGCLSWDRTALEIRNLPTVCHDATDNLTDAGHFALMALGEMEE
jgi:hypothetical protein